MDILYEHIVDAVQATVWPDFPRHSVVSQIAIYYWILLLGAVSMYLGCSGVSFLYFFIHKGDTYYPASIPRGELMKQVKHEIWIAMYSLPFMAVCMSPFLVLSHRGYSKVYKRIDDYGWAYFIFSVVWFIVVTDCAIYFVHRGLHHRLLYKSLHKLHHTYKWTTPFSSHAFHALDGFAQGMPYYIFIFLFPVHNVLFVVMFSGVNFWTILIHDQIDFGLSSIVNTTDHHTIHHSDFKYNYGQYFTLWDRFGGTYRPSVQTHDLLTGTRLRDTGKRK